ncbi:MAG: peptidoglycan-associated lipoprotein Pal [Phenylobacterium sp.]|uniref:peptidoglycan-associated lipoprotein Pal n=1 Tax=Phenylobacterium sp. TaxID=1871053 RepID=UPI001A385D89|nr:peptidoglycan-associated lipoprotein Pal [Phenylobacterium sp.]MBL8772374.1 peptidoglycan-associated lipoprotein Pal [Phenylobacterium sp.]
MITSARIILAAAAAGVVLSGCATKPKPAVGASATPAEAGPTTAMPTPAPPSAPDADPSAQQALIAAAGEDRVYFDFDSDALDGEDRETLRRQAAWLAANPSVGVRIEGHADERGTREYNLALGARRAAAVRQALITSGVASARIATLSFGKERPLDPASTEDAWARNRNAQTVVIGIGQR